MLTTSGLTTLSVVCIAILGATLIVVLIVVVFVLVALLLAVVVIVISAVLLIMTALLAVIVGSAPVLALACNCDRATVWPNILFIIVGIVAVLLVVALLATGVVVILPVLLVVVIVRVLALALALGLGLALTMAVAVVVMASLRMSGHRGGRLELRCRNCGQTVNSLSGGRGAASETQCVAGERVCVPQTMGIRGDDVELVVLR